MVGDVSGAGALRKHTLVGETPHVAARLQAMAEPGTIVVAASTRRLLGDLFRLRDLGRHEVKGIAEPVAAWAVEGVSASESRFDAAHAAGLTDLIGRENELQFLLERQRLAWRGEGQIVLISGEPIDSVKHAYTRALQLCKESGFDEHTLAAAFGLWT
jgi:hypothetical protein